MARIEAKTRGTRTRRCRSRSSHHPGSCSRSPGCGVRGNRAYISGHIAQNPDGSIAQPLGKVGAEVTAEQGYQAARWWRWRTWAASSGHWATSTG